jgi:diguanylate cyclase (GGDEF)-like protein/PAS domain S-box-containing protein
MRPLVAGPPEQAPAWADVLIEDMAPTTTSIDPDTGTDSALARESRIARLFEMTSELLATISLDGHFTLLNPAWEQILGWTREELQAHPIHELMHPDDVEPTRALMLAGTDHPAQMENFTTRYRHRDGSWRWLLWSARCDGDTWYAAARDVTDRMWLERQALHDPLTRLPNRLLLMDRARQALMRLSRSTGVVALLFIDLDRFKAVNDNLGHEVGDQLLIAISNRLAEMMRDSDTVARLGGDEFVILAEEIENDGEALALAERVVETLEEPFRIGSAEVSMLASVGVSVSHDPEADPESMLREADVAMYRAKRAGGRGLELFDERLRQEVSEHVRIEDRLRRALPQHELVLDYQPIVPLAGGPAVGCEALLRWRPESLEEDQESDEPQSDTEAKGDSESEQMLPSTFLPRAAESELIVQIGNWVLHTACMQAEIWRRNGISIPISVNISARELTELDLAERVHEELSYCRLPGHALCLEVSEEAILRDPERAREALTDVKRLGVSIALDNVGAGHTSLSLPRNLPLDMLKLDPELVQNFDRDKSWRAVFAATIALAHEARLTAVAVGIETKRQLALARELDCSMGQGFLLHNPAAPAGLRLKDSPEAITSAPWRPLVRLRGSSRHR